MNDDRDIAAAFSEGLEPVMDESPPIPEWESLQFESATPSRGIGQWWVAAVAAVLVMLVGAGSFLLAGRLGGNDEASPGGGDTPVATGDIAGSIEGRWVLESWEEGGDRIVVDVGVNTVEEPWIEFTSDFDGAGEAGTLVGSTGCNGIRPAAYEYAAGFLVLGEIVVQAVGCEPNEAEQVLLSMLWNTPDGIEVIMGSDRMEWFGSNLEGFSFPLVFRRDGSSPPDVSEATSSTTTLAPEEGLAIRVYEVDGIEVVTPSLTNDLPEQATRVEFNSTVIDSGKGPEICVGIVLDSLPPQCSGPVATGLDMDGWSEEASGVRWGDRSVVVTWPPRDGVVEVLAQSEFKRIDLQYPPGDLPAQCENIEMGAGSAAVNEYARSLGESNGGLYVTNGGRLVLQVVGDPAPHREAMAESGGACVVEVLRSQAEQLAIQDSVHPLLVDVPELLGTFSSSTGPGGRVDIHLPVVDRATAAAIASIVDDPTAIRIIGVGILHP